MSVFGLVNTTTNIFLGGLTPPPKVVPPPALPPVSESNRPQTANPDPSTDTTVATGNTAPGAQPAAPKGEGSAWAGYLPPPADTGGATFDFSPEALEKAGSGTAAAPGQAASTSPTRPQTDAPLAAEPAFVTGRTMVRVESDEDRVRAWAISALQQERRAALPLSLVTNATATPPAQAGSTALDGSSMIAAKADLAATPARVLARA